MDKDNKCRCKTFQGPCPKGLEPEDCFIRLYSTDNPGSASQWLAAEDCQGIVLFYNAEDHQTVAYLNKNCLRVLGAIKKFFGVENEEQLPPKAALHIMGDIFSVVLCQNIGTPENPEWKSVTQEEALDIFWANVDEVSLHLEVVPLVHEGDVAA
ncbi:MAG: hypothetical protein WCG84_03555 [Candidatus Moraniibacteriota bacterium]